METDGAKMDLTTTQSVIVNLKAVKERQNLSIPRIKEMVDSTGAYISLTTLRRVFAEKSEKDDSFNYDNTIRPIAQALLVNNDTADDGAIRAQMDTYLAICRHKDEVIEALHKQIDALKEAHENRCREYETRMAFLRDQIELKDQRMDRKDQIIDKLLEKVL